MSLIQFRTIVSIACFFLLLLPCTIIADTHIAGSHISETPSSPEAIPKTFVFSGTQDTQHTRHGIWLQRIYREVLRRMGYQFQYQGYPTRRATALVEKGEVDAEITRAYSYLNEFPQLIRVEEPHFYANITAYTTLPNVTLTG